MDFLFLLLLPNRSHCQIRKWEGKRERVLFEATTNKFLIQRGRVIKAQRFFVRKEKVRMKGIYVQIHWGT